MSLRPLAICTRTSAMRCIGRPIWSDENSATANITRITSTPKIRLIQAASPVSPAVSATRSCALIGADRHQFEHVARLRALRFGPHQQQVGLRLRGLGQPVD